MADNIITAVFGATRETKVRPRYRYDVGQVLVVRGVKNLPDFYEVHFSNEGSTADATPLIGTPDGVAIPDSYFQSGATIYAYIYVHNEATDGTTVYKVTIPIINRARPANVEPTPEEADIIAQAIEALNENVGKAEDAAELSEASAERAEAAAAGVEAFTDRAEAAAQAAEAASEGVEDYAVRAETAEHSAQSAAQSAHNDAESAQSAAQNVQAALSQAQESAIAASQSETNASDFAAESLEHSEAALRSAEDAVTANTAAQTAKTNAEAAAAAATAAQTAAETAETHAGDSASQASTSAQSAADSAAEAGRVLDSIPADYSQMSADVADLKSAVNDHSQRLIAVDGDVCKIDPSTCTMGGFWNHTENNGWYISANNNRAYLNNPVYLKVGDILTNTNNTVTKVLLYWEDTHGNIDLVWTAIATRQIETEGTYYISIARVDGAEITTENFALVATGISIYRSGAMMEDISKLKSHVTEIESEISETTYTPFDLTADKGWNAYNKNVGDTFNPEYMADASGTRCVKIAVTVGEVYKINAQSGAYAYRSYVITDSAHKITRITNSSFDGEISINQGEETLYCTFQNYNSQTNGVWKKKTVTVNDKVEAVDEKINEVDQVNFAEKIATTEPVVIGKGYSMGSVQVGDQYTSTTTDNENVASQVISVEPDTTYFVYGVGNQYSFNVVCVLDGTDKVISIDKTKTDYRTTPKVVTPSDEAAKIIVNYWNYSAETDKTLKQKDKTIDKLFDSIEKPLNGKTILLLGDSILGNDRFNGVSTYLGYYTGATIINGAIGGSRICGNTRDDDYTPFDGENLVTAITTGVWTDQDAHASAVSAYVAAETLPALKAMNLDDVNIVLFNWMTNDYRANTTAAQYQTAYKNVVGMLLTANPRLRLVSTTMQWFETNDGGTDVTTLYTIGTGYDAADCTIEVAREMHVPVIDMYRESPVCSYTKNVYMDIDYLHPNTLGNMVYAKIVTGKFLSLFGV